jgi:hypothetical protein
MYRYYRHPLIRVVPVHHPPQLLLLLTKRRFVLVTTSRVPTGTGTGPNSNSNAISSRTIGSRTTFRYESNTTQPPPASSPPSSSTSSTTTTSSSPSTTASPPSTTTSTTTPKSIPQQQQQHKNEPTIIGHFISRSNKNQFTNRIAVVEETSDGKKRIAMIQKKIPAQQTTNTHNNTASVTSTSVSAGSRATSSATSSTTTSNTASSSSSSSSSSAITTYQNSMQIIRVGLPLILFSILSAWVVSNAYGGKLKELEVSQGKASISIRQATLQAEHDEMMERLNKIISSDYDNTKRIKRPEEVLEERRLERQKRNVWYRRWYRAMTGSQDTNNTGTK